MTKKAAPTFPRKRLQPGDLGWTVLCPSWPWLNHQMPTDGSGYAHYRAGANDDGSYPTWPYPAHADPIDASSNDLAALLGEYSEDGRKWDLTLLADATCWYKCASDPTKMDDWLAKNRTNFASLNKLKK